MPKQTKQQLLAELEEKQKEIKRLENILYSIKLELWDSASYQYKVEDIIPEIKSLANKEGIAIERRNTTIEILKDENYRYWMLIRSLSGDKTLEKEFERKNLNPMDHLGRLYP